MTESSVEETADTRLALFDFAFRNAPIGIALVDIQGRILRGNDSFARMTGLPIADLVGKPFADFTHPDDLWQDMDLFNETLAGLRDGYSIEKRYVRPDHSHLNVRIHVAAMRDDRGSVVRFITQIEDISKLKADELELAERAARLELALQAVRGGFWHMDIETRTFETSERLAQFIGGPKAARMDLDNYLRRINSEDGAAADLTPLLVGTIDQNVAEYRLETVAGERWMRCDRRLIRGPGGNPLKVVGMAIDFTDEHLRLEMHRHDAETDPLTGLLNRRGLEARFARRDISGECSVMIMDLDGFKQVNDVYGHAAGDIVLKEASHRILGATRGNDLVARTGGDEFLILVEGDHRSGEVVAERITRSLRRPIVIASGAIGISSSIGGVWQQGGEPLEQMITAADKILYDVKAAGKNAWSIRSR